jgi:hypothetical protein
VRQNNQEFEDSLEFQQVPEKPGLYRETLPQKDRRRWLIPIISAAWEAEIGRMEVRGQPRETAHDTPISKITRTKMDWTCGVRSRVLALQV